MYEAKKAKLLLTTGKDNLCDQCLYFMDVSDQESLVIDYICQKKKLFSSGTILKSKKVKCKYFIKHDSEKKIKSKKYVRK
jgi:hypothetical protein